MTTQETKNLFGKNVKYYRMRKNWLQERVAFELGVYRNHISRYETGKILPEARILTILAMVLEVEVWQLFFKLDEGEYNKVFNKKDRSIKSIISSTGKRGRPPKKDKRTG